VSALCGEASYLSLLVITKPDEVTGNAEAETHIE
jgi:hypothetical protein